VHYVVTEFGITNLFGKNLVERAKELIKIAHPDQQEELTKSAYERFKHHSSVSF
jgi:acyl-CoA hydrolase